MSTPASILTTVLVGVALRFEAGSCLMATVGVLTGARLTTDQLPEVDGVATSLLT